MVLIYQIKRKINKVNEVGVRYFGCTLRFILLALAHPCYNPRKPFIHSSIVLS